MNGSELLHSTLDWLSEQDEVARLARNLVAAGVTEETLAAGLGERCDLIAQELRIKFRRIIEHLPIENQYGLSHA